MRKSLHSRKHRELISALKAARKAAGLTQVEVAKRLGRPQSFVAKLEACERRLDVIEFAELCRLYGRSTSSVLMPLGL